MPTVRARMRGVVGLSDRATRRVIGAIPARKHTPESVVAGKVVVIQGCLGKVSVRLSVIGDGPAAGPVSAMQGSGIPLTSSSRDAAQSRYCASIATDFRSSASLASLSPSQYSTGGKARLGHISKRGDAYLRNLLVQGARSVLNSAGMPQDRMSRWILELLPRRGSYRTLVAIANKNARIAWALLAKNETLQRA